MSYKKINPIQQFNFQANRVLTYGKLACNPQEILEAVPSIRTLDDWNKAWLALAQKAEREDRYLHAAYYYRMSEFFLKADNPQKEGIYEKCLRYFYLGFDSELHLTYKRHRIPFENGTLNCITIPAVHPKELSWSAGAMTHLLKNLCCKFVTWLHGGILSSYLRDQGRVTVCTKKCISGMILKSRPPLSSIILDLINARWLVSLGAVILLCAARPLKSGLQRPWPMTSWTMALK